MLKCCIKLPQIELNLKCALQGQKLMMIGTADEIVKAPEKGPVFVEDLPEEEQVIALVHTRCHSVHVLPVLSLFFITISANK